jgi:hypothetical protein
MAKVRRDRENGRPSRSRRSYKVAERFVDLEQMLDRFLKVVAGRTSTDSTEAEYPKIPGEEHRNPEISGLAAAVENFNRSRTPSVRRESNEGDAGTEEEDLESPGGAHARQDSGGFLAVPRTDSRRSGVHYNL